MLFSYPQVFCQVTAKSVLLISTCNGVNTECVYLTGNSDLFSIC